MRSASFGKTIDEVLALALEEACPTEPAAADESKGTAPLDYRAPTQGIQTAKIYADVG